MISILAKVNALKNWIKGVITSQSPKNSPTLVIIAISFVIIFMVSHPNYCLLSKWIADKGLEIMALSLTGWIALKFTPRAQVRERRREMFINFVLRMHAIVESITSVINNKNEFLELDLDKLGAEMLDQTGLMRSIADNDDPDSKTAVAITKITYELRDFFSRCSGLRSWYGLPSEETTETDLYNRGAEISRLFYTGGDIKGHIAQAIDTFMKVTW